MRLLDALRAAAAELDAAGIEDAFADAEVIVLHAAGMERLAAYLENPTIDTAVRRRIRRYVRRRIEGEPVQYLTGAVEFLGLRIAVGRGVLIPRPETELLADSVIARLKTSARPPAGLRVLDVCTGSGCIALALARAYPDATVIATDISRAALRYARRNALNNTIPNASFRCGPLFKPAEGFGPFDLIVSNPPYIPTCDIEGLQREIREWEPHEALDGGDDGLEYYRAILADAGRLLREEGLLMLEIGFDQGKSVALLAERAAFREVAVEKDYAGHDRIFSARAPIVGSAAAVSLHSGRGGR